jgi:hypothetical protein
MKTVPGWFFVVRNSIHNGMNFIPHAFRIAKHKNCYTECSINLEI